MTDTLFVRIGGETAVNAAVDIFYRRVLGDTRISRFFDGVDMNVQRRKQAAFLSFVFGGPRPYTGQGLRNAHAKMVSRGLSDAHFDAVVEHLRATLAELAVAPELIAEVLALASSTRSDVLGR